MPISMTNLRLDGLDLPVRADVAHWLGQVVNVLAASRSATWVDLREQLGEPDGSKRFKRLVQDYLPRSDLATSEVVRVFGRRHWLGLIRLTERGKDFARAQGVEPVENDWERVIRLHQGEAQAEHAGLLLAFDLRARRRGWTTQVLPEVSPPIEGFAPDVWIERDSARLYVEVEGKYHHANAAKWQAARRAQGFAAIVARTPKDRARWSRTVGPAVWRGSPRTFTGCIITHQRRCGSRPGQPPPCSHPAWITCDDWSGRRRIPPKSRARYL